MYEEMTTDDAISVVRVVAAERVHDDDRDIRALACSAEIAAGAEVERKPEVLFLEDVAGMLRVSRSTIERRRRDGTFPVPELPSLDRRPRWSRRCVEQYLAAGRWATPTRGRPRRRLR